MALFRFLRALLFYLGYATAVIVTAIVGLVLTPFVSFKTSYFVMSRAGAFALWWARVVCGIRFQIEGRENIPTTPCVVASNHQSAWETYLLGLLFYPQATVLKQELIRIPFFGWALKKLNPIAIDRSKPALALKQMLTQGKQRLQEGLWVIIYPEGTRVRPGKTAKYTKGAAMLASSARVPILPVAHNAGDCWPAGTMLKKPGLIQVKIGPLIDVEGRDRNEVHTEMETWIRENSASLKSC